MGRVVEKLMTEKILEEVYYFKNLGVSTQKIMNDKAIFNISRTKLEQLLMIYGIFVRTKNESYRASLFPEWLNDIEPVQLKPTNWHYKGKFPSGEWIKIG